ncbi:VOC family protein [Pseudanabaena sp. UWO310]|uniref:VOC family protein n=1 Tax=Pseudanabaena sp. UWO310 TaxID=2480795 RepID=UPI00115BF367|nr:VOC family protein [Pseudanabaena sp. UWO310]TYQ31318.1 VOC family protein [Pseudanabaena sp. UWO310]
MQLNPYLTFNGQCEAAFKFYEQCLGGKIVMMMTHGESPMAEQTAEAWRDKILHAQLTIGDIVLMGSDAPSDYLEKPQGFYVNLQFEDVTEAERVFQALADSGTIRMPLQETFWAKRFGMFVDRFGIPWMVNCSEA